MYFNPEDAGSIAQAIRELIRSHDLRARLAHAAFGRAQAYSWKRCAEDTFEFLARTARGAHAKAMN